ncbi:MAG: thioredoxin fold domain-containing protein [Gammaproteobacteria bacterium]
MKPEQPNLPSRLSREAGTVNIVLVSQAGCPFCRIVRENYLIPLVATRLPEVQVAEVELANPGVMQGWSGEATTQAGFARHYEVRFAPTVLFLDGGGKEIADRIVGLSNDYFGAYLEAAIVKAHAQVTAR